MKRVLSFVIVCLLVLTMAGCDILETYLPMLTEPAVSKTKPNSPGNKETVTAETTTEAETTLAQTEPAETDPAQTEPAETDPTQTEPAETEPVAAPEEKVTVQPLDILLGNHYKGKWTEDYMPLGEVTWKSITLGSAHAGVYPELHRALTQYNKDEAGLAEETLQYVVSRAEEHGKTSSEEFWGYSSHSDYRIQRADNLIVSAAYEYETQTDDAYRGLQSVNFDPETGKAMTVADVVNNWEQLPEILAQKLADKYSDMTGEHISEAREYMESFSENAYTWTLNYQGMTFYFGEGELVSDMMVERSVTLWFDEYPDFFVKKYTKVPENGYALVLSQTRSNDVDLVPGDGRRDQLQANIDFSVPEYYGPLYITVNGETTTNADFYGYSMDAYLVTYDNQHFYLYLDTSSDNDYRKLLIYDLTDGTPKYVTALDDTGFYGEWLEDDELGESWFRYVFNDPSEFVLNTGVDLLGTLGGLRPYAMDPASGVPQSQQEYYDTSDREYAITTATAVEVISLPDMETLTLEQGTRLTHIRTDRETYVDFRLDDGSECRVEVTYQDWQQMVNGRPIEECFDGLIFAG